MTATQTQTQTQSQTQTQTQIQSHAKNTKFSRDSDPGPISSPTFASARPRDRKRCDAAFYIIYLPLT